MLNCCKMKLLIVDSGILIVHFLLSPIKSHINSSYKYPLIINYISYEIDAFSPISHGGKHARAQETMRIENGCRSNNKTTRDIELRL